MATARIPKEVRAWAKACKNDNVIGSKQIYDCLFEKAEDKYGRMGIPRRVDAAIMKTGARWTNAQRGERVLRGARRRRRSRK